MKTSNKKIACIGTHSVGKSTFCYQLAEKHKKVGDSVHIIQERVRFSPFPINESMKHETCLWACTNQVSKELEAFTRGFHTIICDRSIFDPFIYAKYFNLTQDNLNLLEKFAIEWFNTYSEIYFIRPDLNHLPQDDGTRSTDIAFINSVDKLFEETIETYKIKTTTIYTSDIFS